MGNMVIVDEDYLDDVARVIQSKLCIDNKMKPSEMPVMVNTLKNFITVNHKSSIEVFIPISITVTSQGV